MHNGKYTESQMEKSHKSEEGEEGKTLSRNGMGWFLINFFLYFLYLLHEKQYVIRPGNSENYFPVEKGLHLLSMGEKTIVKLI